MAPDFYINLPYDIFSWLGWLVLALVWMVGLRKVAFPIRRISGRYLLILIGFAGAAYLSSQILVLHLTEANIFPVPGVPIEPITPALIALADLPWLLAAGFLAPAWSVLLAVITGVGVAFGQTHQLFTILEYAGMALIFNLLMRQSYRAWYYGLLRHPLGSAVVLGLVFIPISIISAFFSTPGPLEARIDYALTQNWFVILARSGELLLAGLVGEIIYLLRVRYWFRVTSTFPSPEEKSLRVRVLYGLVPLLLILIVTLTVGDWIVAGNAARRMIQDRLSSTAQVAADSLPYFLEAGQQLLQTIGTSDLAGVTPEQAAPLLASKLRAIPFFTELEFFNTQGEIVNGYPNRLDLPSFTTEERSGIGFALKPAGVISQTYIVPAESGKNSIQVSFLYLISGSSGQPLGVLLGRTDFMANPFTIPALTAMQGISDLDGEGVIVDENGKILYSAVASFVGTDYVGRRPAQAEFFDEVSSAGERRLVYYQPMVGRSWAVVLRVPAAQIQRSSLEIALPLLIILGIVSLGTFAFLGINLRTVARSLRNLSQEAGMISQGQLEHPLAMQGDDEVGQLSRSFEQMRQSLKARLDELNSLLRVSQGVAASLKVENSLPEILEAAGVGGASASRVVLERDVTLDLQNEHLVCMGRGPQAAEFTYLDEQLFDLLAHQPMLTIPNMNRVRRLTIPNGSPQPGSLIALALVQDNRYYGTLWVAYDEPHNFSEAEVRFLGTLAGQAALAASNARLYSSAEIGRQRLFAVLASSPEPVLVIDEKNRLLLMNPAANAAPGLVVSGEPGRPIREVVANLDLLELLMQPLEEKLASREISLLGGRVYSASVSQVFADARLVGRVCVLQDITHYKELDSLKSDFVATVSHDLRSPLTLMRGYATMLQMVGELNDQQRGFQKKILTGVENMNRLVNNLLDLGRLEAGISLQVERVNAQEIVAQILSTLQPGATQKQIQMEHESVTLPPVYLEADRSLLQQAITNLVENAIKYTPVGGQIKVAVAQRPTTVVFSVKDNGIGIAPLDMPRLFEKFYRSGRREAHAQKGSGLGLAIVKSIAERHAGKVWVDSTLGKGSTFFLEIPVNVKK